MVDLVRSLTDQLLQRRLDRTNTPNIQQQLLADLQVTQDARAPLTGAAVDPLGDFSARANTNTGMMNEGIGNFLNALQAPTRRAAEQEEADRVLNQQKSDRNYQQSLDRMNAQVKADNTQFDRGQKVDAQAETTAARIADDLRLGRAETNRQDNINREYNSPENQNTQRIASESIRKAGVDKDILSLANNSLTSGKVVTSEKELLGMMAKANIPANRLSDVQAGIASQSEAIASRSMIEWDAQAEEINKQADTDFQARVGVPFQNRMQDTANKFGMTLDDMMNAAQGKEGGISKGINGMDLLTEYISAEDGALISDNQMADMARSIDSAIKKSGGQGFNANIVKNALSASLTGRFNGDIVKSKFDASFLNQMNAFGMGNTPEAKARREAFKGVKAATKRYQKQQTEYDTVKNKHNIKSRQRGVQDAVKRVYGKPQTDTKGNPVTHVNASPMAYKDSPMAAWTSTNTVSEPKPDTTKTALSQLSNVRLQAQPKALIGDSLMDTLSKLLTPPRN